MNRILPLALLGLTLACRDDDPTGPGRIALTWTGADTGQLRVPALARWCGNDSVVEITGVAGDSGVAVAMLPRDSALTPGELPVGMPLPARIRPSARVALRWVSETLTEGYYGLQGTVTIDSGSSLSGRVDATLRSINDGGEINLSGTFTGISVQPGSEESCGLPVPVVSDSSGP